MISPHVCFLRFWLALMHVERKPQGLTISYTHTNTGNCRIIKATCVANGKTVERINKLVIIPIGNIKSTGVLFTCGKKENHGIVKETSTSHMQKLGNLKMDALCM